MVDLTGIDEQTVVSVFNYLPQNAFTAFLVRTNEIMSLALMEYVPDAWWSHFFLMNPLFFLIIFFAFALTVHFVMDFAADAWKMPFAMLVDIINILAISQGYMLNLVAAAGALASFYVLVQDPKWAKHAFGIAGATKCLIPVPAVSVLPVNTGFMLIATVIDKGI